MADVRRRRAEYWVGLAAASLAVVVASARLWPVPRTIEGSGAQAILDDPILVGMLRLAMTVLALYGIASVPALVVGGRWAKGLGTTGIVAGDARVIVPAEGAHVRREIAELEFENERLSRERDELLALVDEETRPQ